MIIIFFYVAVADPERGVAAPPPPTLNFDRLLLFLPILYQNAKK